MTKTISLSVLKKKYIQLPYDTITEPYFNKHFNEQRFNRYIDRFASLIPKNALVLDAGCGPGGETRKLLAKKLRVISIDISQNMLKKAHLAVPQGTFRKMDVMNIKYPPYTFDAVWSARTLIHIPHQYLEKTLRGFYRVLRKGGVFCLIVLGGTKEGIEPEFYDPSGKTYCFLKYFTAKELGKRLVRAGFSIINHESFTINRELYLVFFAKKSQ